MFPPFMIQAHILSMNSSVTVYPTSPSSSCEREFGAQTGSLSIFSSLLSSTCDLGRVMASHTLFSASVSSSVKWLKNIHFTALPGVSEWEQRAAPGAPHVRPLRLSQTSWIHSVPSLRLQRRSPKAPASASHGLQDGDFSGISFCLRFSVRESFLQD